MNRQVESKIELKPCPICNKTPIVMRDYSYEQLGYGAWCIIECDRWFWKPHIRVESGKASYQRAFAECAERWNKAVEEAAIQLEKESKK